VISWKDIFSCVRNLVFKLILAEKTAVVISLNQVYFGKGFPEISQRILTISPINFVVFFMIKSTFKVGCPPTETDKN
jgi:hypothetical protein